MKLTANHIIIALMAVVIAVLSWTLIYVSRDELQLHDEEYEEEIETETTATVEQGRAIVRVDLQSQKASGIRLQSLPSSEYESALQVYGSVVNIEGLLETRGRYLGASAERRALESALAAAQADYRRAEVLYQDDRNISEQALREAESRFRVAQARLGAARSMQSVLRDSLLTGWGPVVSEWAMATESATLRELSSRSAALVQLVFPYDLPISAAVPRLMLAPVTARENAVQAQFVSAAPRVSAALPGNTYFYLVSGTALRVGAHVVARVAMDEAVVDGVVVPNEAVVWHAGKSWVYRKHDAETFGRYEISTANELGEGWFQAVPADAGPDGAIAVEAGSPNSNFLSPGDEVVTSGAQLLLSEELKFQIRNENED
ncbi:MAG TPA: hypothetical protein VMW70_05095 [Burkholderiales bacterium]|nr:hypothetical protein [Burkholderiales bacterium]